MIQFPPSRILVPFDFSPSARAALATAQGLAGRFGGAVELFYVHKGPGLTERARKAVLRKLASAAPAARLSLAEGQAAPAIVRHARYSGADLMIMGTEGRVGLKRLRAGSVAEAVVRESPIPVLTVRESAGEPAGVLAPMNLESYAEAGLVAAAQVAVALGAKLTVLHVLADQSDRAAANARKRLTGLVDSLPEPLRSGAEPDIVIMHGDPVPAVLETAPAYGMIVLVARRKSVIGDAVLGTTAERVLRLSPSPVLAVPCPEDEARALDEPKGWSAPALPPF